MTLLERRRQQFFRSKITEELTMTNEDRSQIAVLAARFAEKTHEIMSLSEVIENAINRWISNSREEPCEKS